MYSISFNQNLSSVLGCSYNLYSMEYSLLSDKDLTKLITSCGFKPISTQYLTHLEKTSLFTLLEEYHTLYEELSLKDEGLNAFDVYAQEGASKSCPLSVATQEGNKGRRVEELWKLESMGCVKYYEDLATSQQISFTALQEKVSSLKERIEFLLNQGNLHFHTQRKRVCPYRVYKRETAPLHKSEFPQMTSQERQMIVRNEWRSMADHEKRTFVAQARREELEKQQELMEEFFQQRIMTAKVQAPIPDVKELLRKASQRLSLGSTSQSEKNANPTIPSQSLAHSQNSLISHHLHRHESFAQEEQQHRYPIYEDSLEEREDQTQNLGLEGVNFSSHGTTLRHVPKAAGIVHHECNDTYPLNMGFVYTRCYIQLGTPTPIETGALISCVDAIHLVQKVSNKHESMLAASSIIDEALYPQDATRQLSVPSQQDSPHFYP